MKNSQSNVRVQGTNLKEKTCDKAHILVACNGFKPLYITEKLYVLIIILL